MPREHGADLIGYRRKCWARGMHSGDWDKVGKKQVGRSRVPMTFTN